MENKIVVTRDEERSGDKMKVDGTVKVQQEGSL